MHANAAIAQPLSSSNIDLRALLIIVLGGILNFQRKRKGNEIMIENEQLSFFFELENEQLSY